MSAGSGREDQETRRSVPWLGVGTLAWPSDGGVEGFSVAALPFVGRYVVGMFDLHYETDEAVRADYELQNWCREITEVGLQGAQDRGNRPSPAPRPCMRTKTQVLRPLQDPLYFYGIFQKHFNP